ncbi:MAG TPA: PPOX class F420-dependent oxidoreductase [archaeon]|nr:PPOX class F420-dependent oxidoreductase [archaeon]
MNIPEIENNNELNQLKGGTHISIKTFRKSGEEASTPVWFLEENDKYYVCTGGSSFKVRRIRNNPKVEIAANDSGGGLKGEYFKGEARIMEKTKVDQIYGLFRKKYSSFRLWNFFANLGKKEEKKHLYLEITLK